jgi:large subunit ribosomal protein L25
MSNFELTAALREETGKGASRRLRRESNLIPAILYGGKEAPQKLSFKTNEVKKATSSDAFFSHILTLDVAGKKEQAVIKAMQRHPAKDVIMHMDFLRVSATEKLIMRVPLYFLGEEKAVGVKAGGVISHVLNDLEIKCLPAHLPEFIEVDVSALGMNESLHLRDIKLPANVELAHSVEKEEDNLTVMGIHSVKELVEIEIGSAAVPTAAEEAAAKKEAAGGAKKEEPKKDAKK